MVVVAVVRHRYRDVPVVLPALLPAVEPDAPDPVELPAPVPLLPPVPELEEPAPVSVDVTVAEVAGGGVVIVVVVVSLVVDDEVGEVDVVAVEPGVALVPELLYEVLPVLAPRLQPGRAAVARARTAR